MLRFFQERFLARLGASAYKGQFVLKGGLLLLAQHIDAFRPTVDIDMLGINISSDPEQVASIVKEIAAIEIQDGVRFDPDALTLAVIREHAEYGGLRIALGTRLGIVQSRIQLDIGFGDAVPAEFVKSTLPPILPELPASEILFYPLESVIAEKYQAIVYLGQATSRMKDFYDILFLAERNAFVLKKLRAAMDATFARRETDFERRYFLYEQKYHQEKENLWKAFLKRIGHEKKSDFAQAIKRIETFLEPVVSVSESELDFVWKPQAWTWVKLDFEKP